MVVRKTAWPAGTPCWIDVSTDVDRAVAFYGALFGWEFDIAGEEFGGYGIASKGGHPVAGVGPKQDPNQPSVWTTYLATDDVEATAKAVADSGGQVVVEPMVVGPMGSMAIAVDPVGAIFGLWQAGTNTGADLANEPGSIVWNENLSGQVDAAKAFYASVFGATYKDVEGADDYVTIDVPGAENVVGGIGPGDGGWLAYFQVDDVDACIATAIELGGSVVSPARNSPFGRIATIADDQGTKVVLIAP